MRARLFSLAALLALCLCGCAGGSRTDIGAAQTEASSETREVRPLRAVGRTIIIEVMP